jgi:hypothetical protein
MLNHKNRKDYMKIQGISKSLYCLPLLCSLVWADEPAPASGADAARSALQQKEGDATSSKNLEEVFQASEKQYSLLKKGKVSLNYAVDYTFYRDSRIDIALADNSSTITRFRIQDDAQHSIGNTFDVSYGVRDNLTFAATLPLVAKYDSQGAGLKAVGLGDVAFSWRWQPIPLKRGLPSTTLFASLSTATGDSPFRINTNTDLATGKGYYSMSFGASMSKVLDPIVVFSSLNASVAARAGGLDQQRGSRILRAVQPGQSIGFSLGMAYSLNYDVSITSSFQQSFSLPTTFYFTDGTQVKTALQTSASMNFSLGLRTNPDRIVNVSLGFGLTEDSPDVTMGVSMPIDFLGATKE